MTPRRRTLAFERDVTEQAAHGHVSPDRLIEHAEARAASLSAEYVPDPMLVQQGRDRPRDVREELADGRNHLVWWLEENLEHPDALKKLAALTHICIAYVLLQD